MKRKLNKNFQILIIVMVYKCNKLEIDVHCYFCVLLSYHKRFVKLDSLTHDMLKDISFKESLNV